MGSNQKLAAVPEAVARNEQQAKYTPNPVLLLV